MCSKVWKEYKLGDIYEVSSGLSKSREEFGTGYEFLSFKDVFYNYFVPKKLTDLVNSTPKERQRCSIKRGDVFLTRTSETLDELGMSSVALKDYENATFNGFTKRLRPKNNVEILPEYVGYYFRGKKFRSEITRMSSLTTRASLNNDMIATLKLVLPSLEEQKKIAKVLFVLDEKIQINNQVNEKLRTMTQLLFKHWFLDYEFLNENGMPYKSSSGEMVDSELGKVPKGWKVSSFRELVEEKKERYGKNNDNSPVVMSPVKTGELKKSEDIFNKQVFSKDLSKYKTLNKYDFAYNPARINIGSIGMLEEEVCGLVSPVYVTVRVRKEYHWYLKLLLQTTKVKSTIAQFSSGSVRQNLDFDGFSRIACVIPSEKVIMEFNALYESLYYKIRQLEIENEKLTQIRDTLIPKLTNGEINLSDLETNL
jgi:type I restriction enzyme, S subunit